MKKLPTLLGWSRMAGVAMAASPKVSTDLRGSNPGCSVDVIVQFNETPGRQQHQKVEAKGGKLKTELRLIKGAA